MNHQRYRVGEFYTFSGDRFDKSESVLTGVYFYSVADPHKVDGNKAFSVYLIQYPCMRVVEKALIRLEYYFDSARNSSIPKGCDENWIRQANIIWENYQGKLPEFQVKSSINHKNFKVYYPKSFLITH